MLKEIQADVPRPSPMLRLVQGDVGSGKTLVAAMAALRAIGNGFQAAVMAPTELLAEQHLRNFSEWLAPLGIEVGFLSGRLTGKARQLALGRIQRGELPVVVGTHALFQEGVRFARLALVVVDEQHRFGVAFWGALAWCHSMPWLFVGLPLLAAVSTVATGHGLSAGREAFIVYGVVYAALGVCFAALPRIHGSTAASSFALLVVCVAAVAVWRLRQRARESAP